MFFKKVTNKYEEKIICDVENINDIHVLDLSDNISIKKATDDNIKICYSENEKFKYNIFVEEGTLFIKKEATSEKWIMKHIISENQRLLVYLPSKVFNIFIECASANINVAVDEVSDLKIDSINGNININVDKVANLKCAVSNGNIFLNDLVSEKDIILDSVNGNLVANNISAINSKFSIANGNITATFLEKNKDYNLFISKIMSSQKINNNAVRNIYASSMSGNINIKFEGK